MIQNDFSMMADSSGGKDEKNEQLKAISQFPSKDSSEDVAALMCRNTEIFGPTLEPGAKVEKPPEPVKKAKPMLKMKYPYILVRVPVPDKDHPNLISNAILTSGMQGLRMLLRTEADKKALREKKKNTFIAKFENERQKFTGSEEEKEQKYKDYLWSFAKRILPEEDYKKLDSNALYNNILAYFDKYEVDVNALDGIYLYVSYPIISRSQDGKESYVTKTGQIRLNGIDKMDEQKANRLLPLVVERLFTSNIQVSLHKTKDSEPIDMLDKNRPNVILDLGCGGYFADFEELKADMEKEKASVVF